MADIADRTGFVGCGEMGFMVLAAALEAGVLEASATVVAERDPSRHARLTDRGVSVVTSPGELPWCDRVIMAVRPQQFAEAAAELGRDDRGRLVVSVMAGIGSDSIREALGETTRVICVMPNAPVRVREGMSVLMPASSATPADLDLAGSLFGTIGATAELPESALWGVTAVSGSGPGYVAFMAEAMVAAAVDVGIDPEVAAILVSQTIAGTGRLLIEGDLDAAALRQAVATPAGTTEAGLGAMVDRDFPETIRAAVRAARDRGQQLADGQ